MNQLLMQMVTRSKFRRSITTLTRMKEARIEMPIWRSETKMMTRTSRRRMWKLSKMKMNPSLKTNGPSCSANTDKKKSRESSFAEKSASGKKRRRSSGSAATI